MQEKDYILASGSAQRKALLAQIGYTPKKICPADIDETCFKDEKPLPYIRRIARQKAEAVYKLNPSENILSADTIIVVGQKIIQKSQSPLEQTNVMNLLSGRTHRVITSVCLIDKNGHISQKTVTTKIMMKHLTKEEIENYVSSNEWVGVAGYKIEGLLGGFVKRIVGSYTGVVGLPLYETRNLLIGAGVR
ncbi:MAG: septum formation protein Maf [Alphaproteobacteria bacterium]|nr:septum formation protein Maf [Alphaproteobacteria bacterium]